MWEIACVCVCVFGLVYAQIHNFCIQIIILEMLKDFLGGGEGRMRISSSPLDLIKFAN